MEGEITKTKREGRGGALRLNYKVIIMLFINAVTVETQTVVTLKNVINNQRV